MHCSSVVNAVERGEIDFKNKNDTYCLSSKTFNWFNSTEKIPLSQVENLQNVINFACNFICRVLFKIFFLYSLLVEG